MHDIINFFENKDLKIIKEIGRGGYGSVYLVEYKNCIRAAKLFRKKYIYETKYSLEFKGQNILILI